MSATVPLTKRPLCWVNRLVRRVSPPILTSANRPKGILSSVLGKVDDTTAANITRSTFVPISGYKEHLRILAQSGHPQEIIDSIRLRHEEYYETHCDITKPLPVPPPVPTYPDDIVISSLTDKDGKTYTVERVPFKNFNASTNPRYSVEMYREYGWNKGQMKELDRKINQWEASIDSRDARLEEVMGNYSGKPPAKKKKISIRTRFAKQRVVAIKLDELNDTKEDGDM